MDREGRIDRKTGVQGLLPIMDAREFADEIGLDWWAVLKLRDDGWLSFDPEKVGITDVRMEAEFLFLGSLVAAGCDPRMLGRLLSGLEKPYRHDLSEIYYDWRERTWRPIPREREPEEILSEWISDLTAEGDVGTLSELLADVERALDDTEGRTTSGQNP
jgi:hypothetical protein